MSEAALDFTLADAADLYHEFLARFQQEHRLKRAAAKAAGETLPRGELSPSQLALAAVCHKMNEDLGNIGPERLGNLLSAMGWRRRRRQLDASAADEFRSDPDARPRSAPDCGRQQQRPIHPSQSSRADGRQSRHNASHAVTTALSWRVIGREQDCHYSCRRSGVTCRTWPFLK